MTGRTRNRAGATALKGRTAPGSQRPASHLPGDPRRLVGVLPPEQAAGTLLLLQRTAGNQAAGHALAGRARAGLPGGERSAAPTQQQSEQALTLQRDGNSRTEKFMTGKPKHPVGRFFAGLGEGAINTTIGPWVNPRLWYGYFEKCDDIWNRKDTQSKKDADLLYGSAPWRILQIAVETVNQIATVTTALALVLSIIGAATLPFGGAALVSVGGLVGGIATVAHALTFVLRTIATFRDLHAFTKADKGSPIRARLRGKLWADLGGLLGNAIGVIMGGLGGAFQFGGRADAGANVIGDAVNSSGLPRSSGAQPGESLSEVLVAGAIGQEGNTLADEMTGMGGMLEDAHGEKAKARALRQPTVPQVSGGVNDGSIGSETSIGSTGLSVGGGSSLSSSTSSLSQSDSSSSMASADIDSKVDDFNQSVSTVNALSLKESQRLAREIADQDEAKTVSSKMAGEGGKLAGESTKLDEAKSTVNAGDEQVEATAKQVKKAKPKEAEVKQATAKTDEAEEVARDKLHLDLPKDDVKDDAKAPADQVKVAQRKRSKISAFFSGLVSKLLGIPRRIKRLWSKAKAKLVALLLKATGLSKPAQEFAQEMKAAPTEIEQAKGTETATKGAVDDVANKTGDLLKLPTGVG